MDLFFIDKAHITILNKYINFLNIFLLDFVIELLKNIGSNKYIIKFEDDK